MEIVIELRYMTVRKSVKIGWGYVSMYHVNSLLLNGYIVSDAIKKK